MTDEDHPTIRARLVAALNDAQSIENRPIDEVHAELAEQGIDPNASVRLAQKLARGATQDDPSTRLLQQIERAEEIDAEIAALERAPIDEINVSLRASGAAPDSASVREPSARPTESKRKRLSTLGWGGSLIGIAASVLLFIAVRPDLIERAETPSSQPLSESPEQPVADGGDAESMAGSASGDRRSRKSLEERAHRRDAVAMPQTLKEAREPPRAEQPSDRDEPVSSEADVADADGDAFLALADGDSPGNLEGRTARPTAALAEQTLSERPTGESVQRKRRPTTEPAETVTRPVLRPDDLETTVAAGDVPSTEPPLPVSRPTAGQAPTEQAKEEAPPPETASVALNVPVEADVPATSDASEIADFPSLPETLTGVVIVDAGRAPATLKALETDKPDGKLAARVGEASLRALGRDVLALIAFTRDGQRVEAAVVENRVALPYASQPAAPVSGLTALTERAPEVLADPPEVLVDPEVSFELVELPSDR